MVFKAHATSLVSSELSLGRAHDLQDRGLKSPEEKCGEVVSKNTERQTQ